MRKILSLLAILLITVLVLSGCGFSSWTDEETIKAIKEIKRVAEDGKVYLVITYTDDSAAEKFEVPEGVSVTDVTSTYDEKKRQTTITIHYSDGHGSDEFVIPDGKDGAKITSAEMVEDIDGKPQIKFTVKDADGAELEPILVDASALKGKDGVDGKDGKDGATWILGEGDPNGVEADPENGIEGKEPVVANVGDLYLDTKSYSVYENTADGWKTIGSIKGTGITSIASWSDESGNAKGYTITTTDGNGVKKEYKIHSPLLTDVVIEYDQASGRYYFTFESLDVNGKSITIGGSESDMFIGRQPTWFSDGPRPAENYKDVFTAIAHIEGDFYYSTNYNEIWTLKGGAWELLIKLSSSNEQFTITFNPGDGVLTTAAGAFPAGHVVNMDGSVEVKISAGKCYDSAYLIPVPVLSGYEFVGWCRRSCTYDELTVTDGFFTNMVPVYENMVLYAIWKRV